MIATGTSRKGVVLYIQIFLLFAYFTAFSDAGISCESDQLCQDLYQTADSVCLSSTKECSNPFQKGCLRSKGIKTNHTNYAERYRVCTSAEEKATDDEICQPPDIDYPEIRIHNADWASNYILAWIYQIVLVEVLGVPASVGLTTDALKSTGFYSPNNSFPYTSPAYPYDALKQANIMMLNEQNCENTQEPCVHILPEVWNGQVDRWEALEKESVIDPPTSNGIVYKSSLMVPKKTLQEHPFVGNVYGLQDPKLVAPIFKKPTKWVDFCDKVSLTNCSVPDDTAARYPDEEEKSLYFLEGSYTGYFMATDANNCANSDSLDDCHGYVIGPPCDWTAFLESQLYWNNIGLKLDSPDENGLSHSYSSMIEIWKAANATGSHVIMWWWLASDDAQVFSNSSYAPLMVQLPQASKECIESRPTGAQRCSADPIERRGSPLGACDNEHAQLMRLTASAVNFLNDQATVADRSPATAMLDALKVTEYDVLEILRKMLVNGKDQFESNAREAVCDWVAKNIHELESLIPRNFPKRLIRANAIRIEHYAAQVIAVFVGLVAFVCIVLTHKYRQSKTMIFAQPTFLYLLLFGYLLICSAAFMLAVWPRDSTCLSIKWMEVLGFTVELVPVLIKTAALNQLISSSKKQQRININRKYLLRKVSLCMIFVVIWLVVWTLLDAPKVSEFRTIHGGKLDEVIIDRECGSESLYWEIFQISMELMLLFNCAILAFQSRNIISVVNESRVLAQMVYSHFLFVILRVLVTIFDLLDLFTGDIIPVLQSFNHSFDSLFAICIYVLPKVIRAKLEPENYRASMQSTRISTRLKTDTKLKVLICTANMGNAEPTEDSMEQWIPTDGACSRVNTLSGAIKPKGYFDIVVIGMQESTWARKNTTKTVVEKEAAKKEGLSEEDILNAMDKHDSATLRLMIQDILGSEYTQIVEELRGQMRLSIWASVNIEEHIKNVRISGANTGIGNVLANKGGIVATMEYKATRLSFISAHLAAHEGEKYYKHRLSDIRAILREGKTSDLSSKLDVTMTSHHMFLLGDLNFRTKFEEEDLTHEKSVQRAMDLVEFKDFECLYMYDELQQGLKNGELLHGFETLPCDFPPTFKVERGPGFKYKKQRTPSYTDRIIYKSMDGFGPRLKPLAYEPCVDFITSDHKPIRGAFLILPNEDVQPIMVDGKLIIKLTDLQGFDLPGVDASGTSDPYVMLMWEGVDLNPQNMGFRDQLRRYYNGNFWPRTRYISRTLDPVWDGEVIHVEADRPSVRKGALLHVVVVDHDNVGKDDYMCATTLSLWDLCSQGTTTHDLDLPVTRDGTVAGRLKFKLFLFVPRGESSAAGGRSRRGSIFGKRASSFAIPRVSIVDGLMSSLRENSRRGVVEGSSREDVEYSSARGDVENSSRKDEDLPFDDSENANA